MELTDPRFLRKTGRSSEGVLALEREVHRDLERLNYPPKAWPLDGVAPDGSRLLDVLVVGGGMYGQALTFALYREGIRNIRVIDKARYGEEGPWGTYARMEILRSPKHQIGPDLGVPSLTFRAWFEAGHGEGSWDVLYKIHRLDWLAYLLWVRKVLALPIENECELASLTPCGELFRVGLRTREGVETLFAREVVLATGREGTGERNIPSFPSLPLSAVTAENRIFHSVDRIDFDLLRCKHVAVLGANASAFDNAAVALEKGAAAVSMFCRRPHLPQVNKSRWMGFPGFQWGFPALDDATRWEFCKYTTYAQMPPPHESVQRCLSHRNFALHFSEPWLDVAVSGDRVKVVTPKREESFDAVIFGTGFGVDLLKREELSQLSEHVMLWADRVGVEEAARYPQIARFPYLGRDYNFVERVFGACPAIRHLRVISYGAAVSHGALAGDVPGLGLAATQVSQAICRSLFASEFPKYSENMKAFDEAELSSTALFVPMERRIAAI